MSILDQVLYVLDNNIYSEELLMAEYNNVEKPPAKNKCSKMSKVPDTGQKHSGVSNKITMLEIHLGKREQGHSNVYI